MRLRFASSSESDGVEALYGSGGEDRLVSCPRRGRRASPGRVDDVECAAADDVAAVEDVGADACAESAEVEETGGVPGRVSG
jgi:hypothetical protein